jgi:putative ABC transport system ATP-binding protein
VIGKCIIAVDRVSKRYHTADIQVRALDEATIEMCAGELIGVVGPSGSGKTTFLLIAGLLDVPTSGAVLFKGEVISGPDTELNALRDFRRENVGFVFQKPNLIPFLNAIQNVEIALTINGKRGRAATDRAMILLEQFGISHRAHNRPTQLSGGEQQRVAIARALANEPALILADEPTASLDSVRGRQVMKMFRELADRQQVSICVVTHDTRSIDLFDRIIEMNDGRIVRVSTRADLPHRPDSAHDQGRYNQSG